MEAPLLIILSGAQGFLSHWGRGRVTGELCRDLSGSVPSLQNNVSLVWFNIRITVLKAPGQCPITPSMSVLDHQCLIALLKQQYAKMGCEWAAFFCCSYSCLLLPLPLLTSSHWPRSPFVPLGMREYTPSVRITLRRCFLQQPSDYRSWKIKLFQVNSQDDLACRMFQPLPKTYDLELSPQITPPLWLVPSQDSLSPLPAPNINESGRHDLEGKERSNTPVLFLLRDSSLLCKSLKSNRYTWKGTAYLHTTLSKDQMSLPLPN